MMDITKHVIPVGVALAAGWILCNLTYNAGSKVSTADTQIASLAARVDAIVEFEKKSQVDAREDHDKLTKIEAANGTLDRELTMLESRMQSQPPVRFDVATTAK